MSDIPSPTSSADVMDDKIRPKIRHILSIYPFLSATMLQAGLTPGLPPAFWRPVLYSMVEEGEINVTTIASQSPAGRSVTQTAYHLADNPYIYNERLNPITTPRAPILTLTPDFDPEAEAEEEVA